MLRFSRSDVFQIFLGITVLTICSNLFGGAFFRQKSIGLDDEERKLIRASQSHRYFSGHVSTQKDKSITVFHGQPGPLVRQVVENNISIKFVRSERLASLRLSQGINAIGFLYSDFPHIAPNINWAQSNGKPNALNYITNKTTRNQNRRASCRANLAFTLSITAYNVAFPNDLYSCDEYPFASSRQGGKGAHVVAVPLRENCSQGGVLSAFYRTFGYKDGTFFYVVTYPYL
jgi:hypothetical protein